MPKEIVNSRYYNQDPAKRQEESYVKVGWTKDLDHVEMTVAHPYDELPNTKTIYDVLRDELTDPKWSNGSNYAQVLEQMITVHKQGWYVQLDRLGINRLIRILRQARDDAFGRDE
jgi:hypothetical protein